MSLCIVLLLTNLVYYGTSGKPCYKTAIKSNMAIRFLVLYLHLVILHEKASTQKSEIHSEEQRCLVTDDKKDVK